MCFSSDSTVTNQPSAEQSQAFQFRMNAASAGLGNLASGPQTVDPVTGQVTGPPPESGAGYFTNPANSPYHITPPMQQAISGVHQAASNLPPDPTNNWAMNAYAPAAQQYWNAAQQGPVSQQWTDNAKDLGAYATQDIAGLNGGQWNQGAGQLANYATQSIAGLNGGQWNQGAMAGAQMAQAPIDVGGIDMNAGHVDFTPTATTYDPVSVGSMAPVHVAQDDPAAAIQAAQNTLQTIASPAIRNSLQASGLGRSGAEAEGLAQEGVRLQLPITQQLLQAQAQAHQLDAQIQAHQEEVQLLEEQKAKLQAQQLTAQSEVVKQQLGAQIAGIEAQIRGSLAAAQFAGQVQASIAQRTSGLQYAAATLGQLAGMNTAQQQIGAQTGTALMGQLAGMNTAQQQLGTQAGTALLGQLAGMNTAGYQGQIQAGAQMINNLAQMGVAIPGLQSQQYQNQLTGAQTNLQAASLPQQMQMQQYLNQQNYILSLLGATPLPSQSPGGVQQSSASPSAAQLAGSAALIGSLWK